MKVIFKITLDEFNQFKSLVQSMSPIDVPIEKIESIYRTKPIYADNPNPKASRAYHLACKMVFPFNSNMVATKIHNRDCVYHINGYLSNNTKQVYSYREEGVGIWGVYAQNGEYFAFFSGKRSDIEFLPSYHAIKAESRQPEYLSTNAPAGFLWYENRRDHEVRTTY